uniref:Phospho-N-acetylmuramoyl-pentapeptide-transferase n=1 Tax=Aegilops tauschii subsp. strangulata TaxID=200361 RepID=A0A453EF08_AEGTS
SCPAPHHPRFRRSLRRPPLPRARAFSTPSSRRPSAVQESQLGSIPSRPTRRRGSIQIATSFDDDLGDFSLAHHDDEDDAFGVVLYSSESDWSDDEVVLTQIGDVELPTMMTERRFKAAEGAITVAAHRLATIGKGQRKSRMKIHHFRRRGKPVSPSYGKPTPAMGGLFFIPIGILVARRHAGSNSSGVNGTAIITLIFAVVGLLDDISNLVVDRNRKIPQWIRFLVQVSDAFLKLDDRMPFTCFKCNLEVISYTLQTAAGIYFFIWLGSANISTPYNMKFIVPLPPPFGLAFMGKLYLVMATVCSLSMGTGVTLVDGLDGLAGGVAALALVGLSVAALPICSELSVFGASMSGACTGFLLHNRYRASIVMGRVGSFALGGALATIAACSGMFIPMLIACSVFFLELLVVILQVPLSMTLKHIHGTNRSFQRILPSHYYLRLWGIKEPYIVAGAYIMTCFLTVLAGYLGLVSA